MGDVEGGHAKVALKRRDFGAHLHAEFRVEVGERLVHQEGGRLADDRATHSDTLTLTARELSRLAIEIGGQLEDFGGAPNPLLDLLFRHLGQFESKTNVVEDGHVRIQRVVLEHHRDVAILRFDLVDHPVADAHLTRSDLLKSGDHAERR